MRPVLPLVLMTALLVLVAPAPAGEKKAKELTDQQFGRLLTLFLENPLHEKAKDLAKILITHTSQTPNAAVMLGEAELKWIGKKEDDRSLLLMAAYMSGNTQSQLLSGVRHNDRYSGLVALFAVYRQLQARDKKFKIAAVEELRRLHMAGKLLAHLVELEKKHPSRLSPEEEKAVQELLKKKK
jgi:hypothetical protein